MNNIILADDPRIHTQLLPLTFTRPVSELLIGLDTIAEKWQSLLPGSYSYRTTSYLSEKYPEKETDDYLTIASHIIPDEALVQAITSLSSGDSLQTPDGTTIALRSGHPGKTLQYDGPITAIERPYHLFQNNDRLISADFRRITAHRQSQPVSHTCTIIGDPSMIFISPGATVEGAFLNTSGGPIYIGEDATVMEGSCLRGPIGILPHATVNMGSRIYGATTIGAHCKVGGEINNILMHPYSNKAHDGFLGNAVIGSWCNIGAGCVASNLKNDYTEIKLWDYATRRFLRTGLQFCGLIMGDHSKAGINTMFNTATVTGVGVNIHGTGFPRNFVASFSEGSATAGFTEVHLSKFLSIAERMMSRRDLPLDDTERRLLTAIHTLTETYR